ncbi:MAG: SPOR domain-containing protein [Vicinamibacterales bacterium]|nr:SPOR domain-containing protein [Vicinamibacterales bacterium]
MSEEQARGVHLSDKQIVFGVMTATVVAVVVFLCGVFVGRGVHALRPASGESVIADNRVVPDVSAAGAESEAGAAFGVDAAGTVTAPPDKLTYPERLGTGPPPAESMSAAAEPGPPVPPPDAPDRGGGDGAAARMPVHAAKPEAGPGQAPAAGVSAPSPSGVYTVQVSAVRRRDEAQTIVDRLKKKGFPAFVFAPPAGDPRGGFRVRVGSFGSRQEAAPTAARLQKEGYQPWITR